ncbi:hypothetical protein HYALB_00004547 [Hymenoscyphus albidus]|uniref:Uncharacterized protein n=1 Tax=Hymenoscyphus albidus TaxID=595503 RepID=A0A9N9LXW4_9HELO|nr:hypothetical protein HYALB_00004547 [Hymenoscyphus albidus]
MRFATFKLVLISLVTLSSVAEALGKPCTTAADCPNCAAGPNAKSCSNGIFGRRWADLGTDDFASMDTRLW